MFKKLISHHDQEFSLRQVYLEFVSGKLGGINNKHLSDADG